jgi:hypothetical protein
MARRLGDRIGPFDLVITSTIPRAFETAIAMGFAVDEQQEILSDLGAEVSAAVDWPAPFVRYAEVILRDGPCAWFAQQQVDLYKSIARSLPDGGSALVITHGGIVEIGAVGCLPQADHAGWGPECGYCEGVRLGFDGEHCADAEILRVEGSTVT